MKMYKNYRLRPITNPGGEIRWYFEMDAKFIEPVKDKKIFVPFGVGTLTIGEVVTSGVEWNFAVIDLPSITSQIEAHLRRAGLRKMK